MEIWSYLRKRLSVLVNFHGLQGVRCSFDQLSACRPATSQSQDLGQGVGCRVGEGLQAFGSDAPRLRGQPAHSGGLR